MPLVLVLVLVLVMHTSDNFVVGAGHGYGASVGGKAGVVRLGSLWVKIGTL